MKKSIYTFLFLSVWFLSYGQLETYDLASFSQPEFYRKISFLSPNISFNNSFRQPATFSGANSQNNGLGLNYFLGIEKYNQKVQSDFFFSEGTSMTYRKNDSDKSRTVFQNQSLTWDGKYFLPPNDFFSGIEISHISWLVYTEEEVKNEVEFILDEKQLNVNTTNNIILKVGKGRIENLNVAWHAIRILEIISQHSELNLSEIPHEKIEAFANKLGEIQNIRITDARLEFNKEVEVVFNYLKSENLIPNDSYTLFAKVLDAYRYESFTSRKKGADISVGLGIKYDYAIRHQNDIDYDNLENDDYENVNIDSRIGPSLNLSINYHKPLSHRWQFDFENDLSFGKDKIKDYFDNTDSTSSPRDERSEITSGLLVNSISLSFLKSLRTNMSFNYFSILSYEKNSEIMMDPEGILHTNLFQTSFQYYFSPRHTLNLIFSVSHDIGYKNNTANSQTASLNVSSTYFFN